MISRYTPRGAKIECIGEVTSAPTDVDLKGSIIRIGQKYTVETIEAKRDFESGYLVELQEHPGYGYDLSLFMRVTDISDLERICREASKQLEDA